MHSQMEYTDLLPNEQNWRIGNWQIATDTLIEIIKAQRQIFQMGVKITEGYLWHTKN